MTLETIVENGVGIAVVRGDDLLVATVQDALDLMATVRYDTGCHCMLLPKSALPEAFFDLKTRLAGEILQKYVNYGMKLAVVGDFSHYTSRSLRDFLRETNRGRSAFFVADERDAVERLAKA
jgi:hypothetical protein